VIEIALANEGWGYTRIRDALVQGLKIEIGRSTVADILKEAEIEPAPEREKKRTWKRFMKMHWDTLYACDFFGVEALGLFGTVRYMVFFVIPFCPITLPAKTLSGGRSRSGDARRSPSISRATSG